MSQLLPVVHVQFVPAEVIQQLRTLVERSKEVPTLTQGWIQRNEELGEEWRAYEVRKKDHPEDGKQRFKGFLYSLAKNISQNMANKVQLIKKGSQVQLIKKGS